LISGKLKRVLGANKKVKERKKTNKKRNIYSLFVGPSAFGWKFRFGFG